MSDNSLYLAYKKTDNSWHVVGTLSYLEEQRLFAFKYTQGALEDKTFKPFNGMEDLYQTYYSEELFPLFKNRILYEKRPEYKKFIEMLGLNKDANPIQILALSGGHRITDTLQTFGSVKVEKDGSFSHSFFAHGLSMLKDAQLQRINMLIPNERLYMCLDKQNEFDHFAVLIRTENPKEIVGYCPRYLAKAITKLIDTAHSSVSLYVETVNDQDTPLQYKLRCTLKGKLSNTLRNIFSEEPELTTISK